MSKAHNKRGLTGLSGASGGWVCALLSDLELRERADGTYGSMRPEGDVCVTPSFSADNHRRRERGNGQVCVL